MPWPRDDRRHAYGFGGAGGDAGRMWEDAVSSWEEARAEDAGRPSRRRLALWVPVVFSLLVQLVTTAVALGMLPPGRLDGVSWTELAAVGYPALAAAALALAVPGPLALLLARRFPGPVAVATAVFALIGAAVTLRTTGGSAVYASVFFALVAASGRGAQIWAWATAAGVWVGAALLIAAHRTDGIGVLIPITVLCAVAVVVPALGRSRRERFREMQRRVAERRQTAAQAERVRIARELHDVLAHSLSAINVQASVGLHLFEQQPQKAAEALATIKTTSKDALDEVRQVLGVLRADGDADAPLVPEPGLARLDQLVEGVRAQGLEVMLENGIAEAPSAVQSALYRIVQESLTNIVTHAGASRAEVRLAESDREYLVTVRDDGRAEAAAAAHADGASRASGASGRPGNGLIGMRERAELLGGSFSAAPRPGGTGFEVSARIPRSAA